jgi:glycosyltransferase involved in cell wall biosynthesis
MKIMQVHGRYRTAAPSGENRVVDEEAAALRGAGHRVEAFERHSDEITDWSPARMATLPARVVWNPETRRELARRLEETRPDVVHVHNTFPLISASALHACRDAGVPVVATLHNYKLLCAGGDYFRAGRPCHECAAGAVAPAVRHGCYRGSSLATLPVAASLAWNRSAWRELVSAYIFVSASQRDLLWGLDPPPARVFVKHNFVRSVAAGARRPRHEVVYLGRLDEAKGVPFLMLAWDAFRARCPESALRLVVAGGGPLEDTVRAWGDDRESVVVAGMLDPAAAMRVLQHALAAVVPSQWEETFGLVAIEAMAAGVAPVAPAHGSFPELISDGVDGVLFEPGNPSSLAAVLADLDRDPGRYIALGRGGRRTWQQRFQEEDNVQQLLDIYRFAIAHPIGTTNVHV